MRAQGAAPEGGSSGSGWVGGERVDHNATSGPTHAGITEWERLPQRIHTLLQREGLDSAGAWRAAGARRKRIFGITRAMVTRLDVLVRSAP